MKKLIFTSLLLSVSLFCGQAEEFTGTVERFKSAELAFENSGRIVEIGQVGTRVSPAIYDSKSNVITKGSVIARQDTSLSEAALAASEADLKQATADVKEKELGLARCKQLMEKNALSQKDMVAAQKEHDQSLAQQKKAEASLSTAKYNLEACYLRAPFYGEIESQLSTEGTWVSSGIPVVRLSLYVVMKVTVEVPEDFSRKVSLANKISVLSPVNGERLDLVWLEDGTTDSKKLNLFVDNQKVPAYQLTEEEKKLPIAESVSFVTNGDEDFSKIMWVPEISVFKDEKGTFIWFAKEQNILGDKKIISRQFIAGKKYVKSLDRYKSFGVNSIWQSVENPGGVKPGDFLLLSPPEGLKDGSRVVYQPRRWMLRPGDKVKVVVE
ncbi:MAG TPA: hypothetical protein DET40_25240 [Lentisphaeria bacterium]|nr:MAG: hypothetical protein A2X45_18725 [Lentisphaerae bacterium GWF2_50_93]HCE46866.1 hypothetical protein [Lentisphaeria bacterium]